MSCLEVCKACPQPCKHMLVVFDLRLFIRSFVRFYSCLLFSGFYFISVHDVIFVVLINVNRWRNIFFFTRTNLKGNWWQEIAGKEGGKRVSWIDNIPLRNPIRLTIYFILNGARWWSFDSQSCNFTFLINAVTR